MRRLHGIGGRQNGPERLTRGADNTYVSRRWLMINRALVAASLLFAVYPPSSQASAEMRIEAVPGTPFGVGRISVPVPADLDNEVLDTGLFSVSDAEGRVLYPVVRFSEPLGLVREILGIPMDGLPRELHFHFLFTGSAPLQITLHTPHPRTVSVYPAGRPAAWRRLQRAWWVRYKAAARKQRSEGDYLPVIETYLTHMLARRMGLALPTSSNEVGTAESLAMLLGTEKLRIQLLQDSMRNPVSREESADLSLPSPIAWQSATTHAGQDVRVEPIARFVPEECFYIRFAQFPNYIWLRRLLEEYGGDLSRMVTLRGTDSRLNQRVEQQLGLRESALARILGETVISDVALLGRDTLLREGAAIGIVFEGKNELLAG